MTDRKKFRLWTTWLVETFPLSVPVKFRLVPKEELDPDTWGDCAYYDGPRRHYLIRVDRDLDEDGTADVLQHEYAHCCGWMLPPALGVLHNGDDEIHSLICFRIGRRWDQWVRDRERTR